MQPHHFHADETRILRFTTKDVALGLRLLDIAKSYGAVIWRTDDGRRLTWLDDDGACVVVMDTTENRALTKVMVGIMQEA